jgi:KDO2-lipid IV(A) lauroyltransferase
MQALVYYLALPFIYFVAILPFPLLYLVSDFFYFLLYHVIGYRKKVVFDNLRRSFPGKSEKEIQKMGREFYSYLCDLMLETFKTLAIRPKQALKHCAMDPAGEALLKRYGNEKKSIILVLGHFGNWEWAGTTFSLTFDYPLYVIYHPLRNKHFDNLIYRMRTRFGTRLISMKDTFKQMVSLRNEVNATAFIADQTPSPENAYWTQFLGQDTPVFWGTEKIAQKMNYPVVYITVKRLKRGYYKVYAEELFSDPKNTVTGEISQAHTRKLESDIQQQPEIWLWSHRRWKHKRPVG